MAKVESIQDLFERGLRHLYDCEQKLVKKGLPSMIEAAGSSELRRVLEQHLQETRNHIRRLERYSRPADSKRIAKTMMCSTR